MTESGYYPEGVEHNDHSPWNIKSNSSRKIEVEAIITLSKIVSIWVDDYTIVDSGVDEDGDYFEDIDYSECDIEGAVRDQIILPDKGNLNEWKVDSLEVEIKKC